MVFLRETINEQEALLRRAAVEGRNDASAAVLSASISARVKALTEHLKVTIIIVKHNFELFVLPTHVLFSVICRRRTNFIFYS